jgi:phospholipase C
MSREMGATTTASTATSIVEAAIPPPPRPNAASKTEGEGFEPTRYLTAPNGFRDPYVTVFTFNRSGVRIPTLAISAWIPERTVINEEHCATSLLATMRERWNLGAPVSAREETARSFADIFTLTSPRGQEDWPEIVPRPVPEMPESVAPLDAPLGLLGKSVLLGVLALAQGMGRTVPEIKPEDTITGAQGVAVAHEILGELFPTRRG